MAKRTKRAPALKATTSKKAAKKTKTSRKKAARRPLNTKAKRRRTSAKSGHSAAKSATKKSAPRRRGTPTRRETPQPETIIGEIAQTETTIVDVIEEPVPEVFVVTEFVETNAEPEPTESLNIDRTTDPESEER